MTSPRPRRNPPGTPTEPSRTRSTARATPKRANGRRYTDEERAEVVERLREWSSSIADEHRRTGIPKGTLSKWARDAGVDLGEAARARTATARATVDAKVAEVKVTTVDRLERVLEAELDAHQQRVALERALVLELGRALDGAGPFRLQRGETAATIMLRDPQSQLAQLSAALDLLNAASPKRDTVGAWTRAVHDLALLRGEATERGDVLVRFGIPRPQTDVVPIPQAELGRTVQQ